MPMTQADWDALYAKMTKKQPRCGKCGQPGHNVSTCRKPAPKD